MIFSPQTCISLVFNQSASFPPSNSNTSSIIWEIISYLLNAILMGLSIKTFCPLPSQEMGLQPHNWTSYISLSFSLPCSPKFCGIWIFNGMTKFTKWFKLTHPEGCGLSRLCFNSQSFLISVLSKALFYCVLSVYESSSNSSNALNKYLFKRHFAKVSRFLPCHLQRTLSGTSVLPIS